jgi:hypothetical protein
VLLVLLLVLLLLLLPTCAGSGAAGSDACTGAGDVSVTANM